MAQPNDTSDDHPGHSDQHDENRDEQDDETRRTGDAGDDEESPGRSLIDDDDEIVEPNEPG
jgi:hypothetical protein